jgi:hypothetical protein
VDGVDESRVVPVLDHVVGPVVDLHLDGVPAVVFLRKKVIRPGFIEKAIIGFELGLPVLQATQEGGQNKPRSQSYLQPPHSLNPST